MKRFILSRGDAARLCCLCYSAERSIDNALGGIAAERTIPFDQRFFDYFDAERLRPYGEALTTLAHVPVGRGRRAFFLIRIRRSSLVLSELEHAFLRTAIAGFIDFVEAGKIIEGRAFLNEMVVHRNLKISLALLEQRWPLARPDFSTLQDIDFYLRNFNPNVPPSLSMEEAARRLLNSR